MEDDIFFNCVLHNYIKYIHYCNDCFSYYCMIHYDVCNDKDKYCAILWTSGNYCGVVYLANPLTNQAIGFQSLKVKGTSCSIKSEH